MRNNNKKLTILHLVILDYAGEIKEGWKRVKGADIVLWFWDFLFIGIMWAPWFMDFAWEYFLQAELFVYGYTIGVLSLGFFISRMYPEKLEKTLLLCPLTQAEKIQYVKTGYRLKVGVPMLFYVLAGTVWLFLQVISPFFIIEIGLWMFFYFRCINIYCMPETGRDDSIRRYPVKGMEIFQIAVQLLEVGQIMGMALYFEGSRWVPIYIYEGTITLLQVLLYIIMKKNLYPIIMERALCYEDNY
ncbi:MAG: hypothetical protein HFI77_11990 [Lachnospiraceae bacterium]|nr:hypothetical protein [Lachnospiraceae bacterium]